jgi:hypothetical protein
VAADLVDEYAIYLAPSLLGGDRLALGDIGVTSIGEARKLQLTGVEQLGNDLLIHARPVAAPSATATPAAATSSTTAPPAAADRSAAVLDDATAAANVTQVPSVARGAIDESRHATSTISNATSAGQRAGEGE